MSFFLQEKREEGKKEKKARKKLERMKRKEQEKLEKEVRQAIDILFVLFVSCLFIKREEEERHRRSFERAQRRLANTTADLELVRKRVLCIHDDAVND